MRNLWLLILVVLSFSCQNSSNQLGEMNLDKVDVKGDVFETELIESIVHVDSLVFILSKSKKIYQLNLRNDSILLNKHDLDQSVFNLELFDDQLVITTIEGSKWAIEKPGETREWLSLIKIEDEPAILEHDFEDSEFSISSCCFGEWGGAIFFESKSGELFSTESTCLLDVDTFKNEYYVFNYLGHLSGFSSIIKIGKVRELPNLTDKRDSAYCNWYYNDYEDIGELEYELVRRKNLGNTDSNQMLLDTFWLKILEGSVDERGIIITYQSEQMIKRGKIDNGKLEDVVTLIDTLYGKIDAAASSLNKDDNIYWFRTYQNTNLLKTLNYKHFILIINEEEGIGRIYQLN